jgi:hypothetical protein
MSGLLEAGMKRVVGLCLFGALAPVATPTEVTFTRDVAPILQKNCQTCHRPGEVAPMSLLSYKDVRPWAKAIRQKVVQREMPPWFADPKYGEFSNDCRLPQKDIDTIVTWVDGGAKEGNPNNMPPNPVFIPGWNIGRPDVVFTMGEEFAVPERGVIPYKYYAVPTNFTEDRYVQFAEIRPGDREHVHHVIVNVRFPNHGPLPAAGELSPEVRSTLRQQSTEDSDGRLIGWAPGEAPLILRDGHAKLVRKGAMLIFQMHYTTNGKPGRDKSSVGLIFSKVPVAKRVITSAAVGRNLVIPPGDPNYESTASFTFKEDSHIDSLHPHMHMRGKDFLYRLVYPDGTSKILLVVPRFDFNWQLTYFFKDHVPAPRGSKLEVVAHHDNSPNNKFNPDPTKEVRWGEQTWDEMMIGYFDYTIDKQDLRKGAPQPATSGQ